MNLKETYNAIAEEWHKDHRQNEWSIEGTDKFISLLNKGDLVLDAGCGGGTKSRHMADRGLHVIGMDFAEKMIEIAKAEAPNAEFIEADINDVNKLDYAFDGIFMQAVLLHIPRKNASEVIKKAASRLKKGGYLYVAVKERKSGGPDEEMRRENDYGYPYERFFSYFTQDEIESYMKNCGLDTVFSEVKPSGRTRWIQVIGVKA